MLTEKGKNTRFEFLYRDGCNYKTHNEVVLSGTLSALEIQELRSCGDGEYFIAEQVGLSHDFPGEICDDDHAFCEFYDQSNYGFSKTEDAPTVGMSVKELFEKFLAARGKWDCLTYDPAVYYA